MRFLQGQSPYEDSIRPDVILLDLKLPGLSGLGVLEIIKNDKDLQSIPVVMLTTSAADRDRETAYANHVNSYLVKPMAFERFRALVRELCHYWGEVNCPARDRTA